MSALVALRGALTSLYRHSLLLIAGNSVVTAVLIAVLYAASYTQVALVGLLAIGPLLAAMMHSAVVLARTGDLRPSEFWVGLRTHGAQGLVLGTLSTVVAAVAWNALTFYFTAGPFMAAFGFLALYTTLLFGALEIALWPLAVTRQEPLRSTLAGGIRIVMRRPGTYLLLGATLATLLILATITVLPLLTMFLAYTCLAAAHLTLPDIADLDDAGRQSRVTLTTDQSVDHGGDVVAVHPSRLDGERHLAMPIDRRR